MKSIAGEPAPASEASTSSGGTGNSPSAIPATSRRERHEGEGGGRGQDPAVRLQRHGAAADDHSATVRRRTSQMKNGAPSSAVTMPTSSSAGRATIRPATSPISSSPAPSTML